MKKTLFLILTFLGTFTLAIAQTNTIVFAQSGDDAQTFDVGQQGSDDLNDPNIVTVSGSGTVISNNNFFGIGSPSITDNNATGAFTFIVTTDSATPINAQLNLDMAKRPGCSVSGSVSVTGYSDTTFEFASDGTETTAVQPLLIEFESLISFASSTPLTVTITLNEMLNVDNVNTPIFRLENVLLVRDDTLGIGDVSVSNIEMSAFPNPVSNSFQIDSNRSIQSVYLYNISGRLVKTFSEETTYAISDLAPGIYLAKVSTDIGFKTIRIINK